MDSDNDEIPLTCADVMPLIGKTYKSFILPLFVIAIFFSIINIVLMLMIQRNIDPHEIFVSISMPIDYYRFPVPASVIKYSPSLQGQVNLYLLDAGCLTSDLDQFDLKSDELSMLIISKGNCSLYSKALNAQEKGFSAVLLHDQQRMPSLESEKLRQSLHINILSITNGNYRIIHDYMSNKSVNQVIIKSNLQNVLTFQNIVLEILINLIVIYASEFIVMSSWLIIYSIGNIIIYRRFRFYQLLVDGCLALLANSQTRYVPNLRTIPTSFPEKILDQKNIQDLKTFHGIFESEISSYHDSCCICLEEFQVDNKVRALPCRHLFHSLWYFYSIINIVLILGYLVIIDYVQYVSRMY